MDSFQFELIFLPICRFLQSLGVDFQFRTKVTDIVTTFENGQQTISWLDLIQKASPIQKHLSQRDIVLINLGSTVSGSVTGTNSNPPIWQSIEANEELVENWSLWLEHGSSGNKFGNPYILHSSICLDPGIVHYYYPGYRLFRSPQFLIALFSRGWDIHLFARKSMEAECLRPNTACILPTATRCAHYLRLWSPARE